MGAIGLFDDPGREAERDGGLRGIVLEFLLRVAGELELEVLQGIPPVYRFLNRALQRLRKPDRAGGAAGDVDFLDLLVVLILEVVDRDVDVVADVLDDARDAVDHPVRVATAPTASAAAPAEGAHPGRASTCLPAELVGVFRRDHDDRHVPGLVGESPPPPPPPPPPPE